MSDVSVMSERSGFLIELFAGEEGGNRLTLREVRGVPGRINRGPFLFECSHFSLTLAAVEEPFCFFTARGSRRIEAKAFPQSVTELCAA